MGKEAPSISHECDLAYFQQHSENADPLVSHSLVIDSGKPGPHLVFFGGIHGNESAGVKALMKFHQTAALDCGKVTCIIGNPESYKKAIRSLGDRDFNRSFHTDDPRVLELKNFFEKNDIDFIVDFHTMSQTWCDSEQLACIHTSNDDWYDDKHKWLIKDMPHFVVSNEFLPGCLPEGASPIPTVTIECGIHDQPESAEVNALNHMQNFLQAYGMVKPECNKSEVESVQVDVYTAISKIMVQEDDFKWSLKEDRIKTGAFIHAGETVAISQGQAQIAKEDCYLIMPSRKIQMGDLDAGFLARKETITLHRPASFS